MKLYLTIIFGCVLIISSIITLATEMNFLLVFAFTALAVVLVIVVDALTATVARLLPKGYADERKKVYQVGKREKLFYEKLKIRKWKDKVPEIGHFTGFRKNKIADPKSVEYLDRFLLEACYGEIAHFFSLFTGFLIMLLFPITDVWFVITIPVCIVNICLNLPSLFILRYNSYKLRILRNNLLKKQKQAEAFVA